MADYFVEGTYLGEDMRQLVLGTDLSGREYFYFPCLSNHDVRVYSVQQFPRKASHDDCYQVRSIKCIILICNSLRLVGADRGRVVLFHLQ